MIRELLFIVLLTILLSSPPDVVSKDCKTICYLICQTFDIMSRNNERVLKNDPWHCSWLILIKNTNRNRSTFIMNVTTENMRLYMLLVLKGAESLHRRLWEKQRNLHHCTYYSRGREIVGLCSGGNEDHSKPFYSFKENENLWITVSELFLQMFCVYQMMPLMNWWYFWPLRSLQPRH